MDYRMREGGIYKVNVGRVTTTVAMGSSGWRPYFMLV